MSDEKAEGQEPELPKISRRRKRAAEEYALGNCTKAEAYRRAGMSKPTQTSQQIADRAYQLFQRPEVKAWVAHLTKQSEEEYEVRKTKAVRTQYLLSIGDIETLVKENGEIFRDTKVSDITKAYELLSKTFGWVKEKVEHSGSIETPKLELILNAPGTPPKAD